MGLCLNGLWVPRISEHCFLIISLLIRRWVSNSEKKRTPLLWVTGNSVRWRQMVRLIWLKWYHSEMGGKEWEYECSHFINHTLHICVHTVVQNHEYKWDFSQSTHFVCLIEVVVFQMHTFICLIVRLKIAVLMSCIYL